MSTDFVVSIIADDKPGLVDSLAQTVVDHQGNWLESRMAQMAGKFAGILRVNVSDAHATTLKDALEALQTDGIKVIIENASAEQGVTSHALLLNLVGNDRPGIVREVSQVLSAQQVNVEDLSTECEPAPHTGEMLFRAQARLQVPQQVDIDTLISTLESLADDLMVEVSQP
ncbi:glycine cleavage system protein R [Aestuariirhabdus sp. LZHN29]|uniref:glycine cleavage system protein R n=1 Tax=Aestuariirhabdus sp. LZHN29 TaxID=3417462 RepID=UPI003CE996EC